MKDISHINLIGFWPKITLVALVTTFLIVLHWHRTPSIVLFDEVYYGPIVDSYLCTHKSVMNNHPPAGKLFLAGMASLSGYHCGIESWHMGEPLRQDPLKVRIGSLGALLIGLVSFCYLVQFTTRKALLTSLAALLFVSDTLLAKSSTLLFLDSTLVAFTLLAILAALVASTRVSTKISLGWATLAGLFCGIALGTKWSGVSALIVCYGILAAKTVRGTQCWKTRALGGLLCTAATAVSYFGGWWIHFHLTSAGGDEEPIRQISTSIADYLIRMHQLYYRSHIITGEFSPHPSSSPWWMWPIGLKPIILGRHNGEEILLEANRPLWTLGSFAILWLAGRVAVMRRRGCLNRLEAIGLFGWAAFYLPIIFTSRWLFMYSYLPAAVFALIGLVGILDRTVSQETIQAAALSQRKWLMALGVAALIIAGVF